MIKMISGVCGSPNGLMHPGSGAFSLTDAEEARLVNRGVAVYVQEIVEEPDAPADESDDLEDYIAPIGFDEIPADMLPEGAEKIEMVNLADLSAKELRKYAKENYDLAFKGNASKAEMIQAIDEAAKAEYAEAVAAGIVAGVVSDDEPAPEFDAAEAVV